MGLRWYVARTHPGHEALAAGNLRRQNFAVFHPCTEDSVVVAGRERMVTMPLFPSYLFVHFDITDTTQRWRSINSTRGVVRLLPQHNETPLPIPDDFIVYMTRRIESGEFTRKTAGAFLLAYERGDVVAITEGTLQGHSGIFDSQVAGTVYLLMQIMGRPQKVPIPAEFVRPKS